MSKARIYIAVGQIGLLSLLVICVIITPHYLFESNEGGVSNFGVHTATYVPYSLAFGLAAICTITSGRSIPGSELLLRKLRMMFQALGLLYALTLLSTYPYQINNDLDYIHQVIGSFLILYSLIFSLWALFKIGHPAGSISGFVIQLLGFGMAVLNFFDIAHLLFVAEALSAVGFAIVLLNGTSLIENKISRHS